ILVVHHSHHHCERSIPEWPNQWIFVLDPLVVVITMLIESLILDARRSIDSSSVHHSHHCVDHLKSLILIYFDVQVGCHVKVILVAILTRYFSAPEICCSPTSETVSRVPPNQAITVYAHEVI